jgi:glycosyltransferase involved in cell wall biosynthesis
MRVLFIHNFYQQYGGEDAVVRSEMDMLESHGVRTQLYSRHNDEIKQFGLTRKAFLALTIAGSPKTRRDLAAVIAAFRPDVAYLHNVFPLISPAAYEVLESNGVPVVQAMHNFRLFCANGLLYTRGAVCERCLGGNHWPAVVCGCIRHGRCASGAYAAALWWMRRSRTLDGIRRFVCLTPFAMAKFAEAGLPPEKLVVRPNSIDAGSVIPEYRGDYGLYLGRLSVEKGLHTLFAAARMTPDLPLVIAGSGPLEAELREAAAGMPHVRFAGFQSGEAKRELLRNARFAVICSEWYENFPMAALEAFAAGKPIVGSDLGSIPHLVQHGETGLLFQSGSARDLAEKMSILAASPSLCERMGRAARKCVEDRYDSKAAFSKLMSIFEDAISGGAKVEAAACNSNCVLQEGGSL